MSNVSLEKLDMIKERTGVTYGEAKEALNICEGDVVEAIVYLEEKKKEEPSPIDTSVEQFKTWLSDTIEKGNVSRIKVKKDDKVIVDVPVNAGVAAGIIAIVWWPIAAVLTATAMVTKVTIEITKEDGTVEVVNKAIKSTMSDVKGKASNATEEVMDKLKDLRNNLKNDSRKSKIITDDEPVYQYTVKFNEDDEEK